MIKSLNKKGAQLVTVCNQLKLVRLGKGLNKKMRGRDILSRTGITGATRENRTLDLIITNDALYH